MKGKRMILSSKSVTGAMSSVSDFISTPFLSRLSAMERSRLGTMKFSIFLTILTIVTLFLIPWGGSSSNVESLNAASAPNFHSTISLEEVCCIGEAGDLGEPESPAHFANIFSVVCDNKGNIYALDRKLNCVRKFSPDGIFIKEFFQHGRGPEDISNANKLIYNPYRDDGRGTLFVLNDNGFRLKEFTTDGKFINQYFLPEQFFYYSEFIDEDRLLFCALAPPNREGKPYDQLKVLDLKKNRVVKNFFKAEHYFSMNYGLRFVLRPEGGEKKVLWTASTVMPSLTKYDFGLEKECDRLPIPGKLRKNTTRYFEEKQIVQTVYYNVAQPVWLSGTGLPGLEEGLFLLLWRKDFSDDKDHDAIRSPLKNELTLYALIGGWLRNIGTFDLRGNECDKDIILATTYKNRLIFYTKEPYPMIKVFQVKKRELMARI